jgi:uncharacterized membrane protein YhaH (DUF805 family)
MNFAEAVKTVLSKYAVFSGRARRSEFWWFVLFNILVSIVASIIDAILGTDWSTGSGLISLIVGLALFIPYLAVAVRRLHDTDRSGWWILIGLIPLIGFIVLLIFTVQDGTPGPNKHGASPKHPEAGYPPPQPGYGAPA